jgi:hypothetical protein
MNTKTDEYINKEVRGLVEPMVNSLLLKKPNEPVT